MSKAIFLDLDGTLLPEGELHKVSDFNLDTLKKAQEKGIYTIISTGRGMSLTKGVHEQINFSNYGRYLITLNGAHIYDANDDKTLWSFTIDDETIDLLITWAKANKYMFIITEERKFFVNNKWKFFYLYPFFKRFEVAAYNDYVKPDYQLSKIGFIVGTKKKVSKVQKELISMFGDKIEVVTSGSGYFIEVTAKGVSKGNAAKLLADYLNIKTDQCAHMGDSMNDYSAFQVVGHPIAMKKASQKLHEKASYITEDAKKDGVAHAVNYLMKDVWK